MDPEGASKGTDPLARAAAPDSFRLANFRLHDAPGLARRLADRKSVDIIHPALDLAPDSILAVEEAGVVEADEELAVGAVRIGLARHRRRAADMRFASSVIRWTWLGERSGRSLMTTSPPEES